MQKDDAQSFWERVNTLIGDERPYTWAENKGINKSSFQSSRNRGTKPLPKTVKLWAELIGCNYEWLNSGVGEPYSNSSNSESIEIKDQQDISNLNQDLLIQAFNALESSLVSANKEMPPKGRSRFISALYQALKQTDDSTNIEVLADCIYTIEEALNLKRQIMSSEAKTRLILAVYELYIYNPAYKDVMQSTITQLVGTLYD